MKLSLFISSKFERIAIGTALALEYNGGIEAVSERCNALALQVLGGLYSTNFLLLKFEFLSACRRFLFRKFLSKNRIFGRKIRIFA